MEKVGLRYGLIYSMVTVDQIWIKIKMDKICSAVVWYFHHKTQLFSTVYIVLSGKAYHDENIRFHTVITTKYLLYWKASSIIAEI